MNDKSQDTQVHQVSDTYVSILEGKGRVIVVGEDLPTDTIADLLKVTLELGQEARRQGIVKR